MVRSGFLLRYLLAFVGTCELIHASKIIPRLDGDWGDWEPGNYGIDPMKWANDDTREAEIKHSRLAMIAFGGLVTQSAGLQIRGSKFRSSSSKFRELELANFTGLVLGCTSSGARPQARASGETCPHND